MRNHKLFNLFVCIALLLISFPVQASQEGLAAAVPETAFNSQETRYAPQMSPLVQICGDFSYDTDVAYNHHRDEYLVVCEKADRITGRFVSGRGDVQGDAFDIFQTFSGSAENPRVAYDTMYQRYLAIWFYKVNLTDTAYYVMGRFIEMDGNFTTGAFQISENDRLAVGDQHLGDLAFAHTQGEFLVVWANEVASNHTWIIGRQIPADGSYMVMGSGMIAYDGTDSLHNPAVAYNLARNEYLVVYDNDVDVFGVRLSGGGGQLGGGTFTIADWPDTEYEPAVAACHTADQYLVGWHSVQPIGEGVYTRFINWDGTMGAVLNPMHRDDHTTSLDIAIDCGKMNLLMESPNYLVAWAGGSTWGQNEAGARMVETSGSMSDAVTINDSITGKVAVAGGNINYLAATSESTLTMSHQVYARIVGNTKPEAGFTVAPAQGDTTTKFKFDASPSTDHTDDDADLQVRWDWTNDGVFDTNWTTIKTAEHIYDDLVLNQRDVQITFCLEVTDGHGETDSATGTLLIVMPTENDTYEIYLPILLR